MLYLTFFLEHFYKSCKSRDRCSTTYHNNDTTNNAIEFSATYRVHFSPGVNPRGDFCIDGAQEYDTEVKVTDGPE